MLWRYHQGSDAKSNAQWTVCAVDCLLKKGGKWKYSFTFAGICIKKLWKETQEAASCADPARQGKSIRGLGWRWGHCGDLSLQTFEPEEPEIYAHEIPQQET